MSNMALVPREPGAPNAREREWIDLMAPALELAKHVVNTDFVPRSIRGNGPAIVAAILYGDELGLGPMQSLAKISVIEGKPTLSAEAQRALILAAGHELWVEELTNTRVVMSGRRADSERTSTVTWTLDDAKRANLAGKANWRLYPRQMLEARATAELARLLFADVIGGLAATEEIEDAPDLEVGTGEPSAPAAATTTRRRRRKTTLEAVEPAGAPAAEPTEPEAPPLPDEPIDAPPAPDEPDDAPAPSPADDELNIGDPTPAEPEPPVVETEEAKSDPEGTTETAVPDESGSSTTADESDASSDKPTDAQLKALNALVGKLRESMAPGSDSLLGEVPILTTEQLYAATARRRNVDVDVMIDLLGGRDEAGVLHWTPLRDSLTFSEASSLIDVLGERAEKWGIS